MAEVPLLDPKRENEETEPPAKIIRISSRKLREFEGHSAANPPPKAKKLKGALLAINRPSYCLKNGVGSLQCGGESLRFQHRKRLFWLRNQLILQKNWPEASGVLSVLLQGTVKDHSLAGNRAKYMAALELLSVIKDGNISKKIQDVCVLWKKKLGPLKYWPPKERFAVQLEFILTLLQRGSISDAHQAALSLMDDGGCDGNPVANLVVGLAFSQLWYSGIPKELQLTDLDQSSTYMQSKIPLDDIHMPAEYSRENDVIESGGANSVMQCDSNTSVANGKEAVGDDGSHQKESIDIDAKVKKETSYTSNEAQEFDRKSAEASGNSYSSFSYNGDLPNVSIFYTESLPPWLLPMKLPNSHENMEDAMYMHRKLLNDYYKNALKHLRVALHSTPPVTEALHPLIQMLVLGDQVHEALDELETISHISDTVLQLRLKASLLEHFDSGNYIELCKCFEDILKKDPTCSHSLARLVVMHRRGDYETENLVEMIALHLDASYGTCDTWQELASCFLELSQSEGDRISIYGGSDPDSQGCLDNSNKIPKVFTCGESGKAWRLRSRWWLNRHFHERMLVSDTSSGNLKLLTYKAATASHIYGRHFKYVVKTTECIEKENDMELYRFLQMHILNSVGFCSVKRSI